MLRELLILGHFLYDRKFIPCRRYSIRWLLLRVMATSDWDATVLADTNLCLFLQEIPEGDNNGRSNFGSNEFHDFVFLLSLPWDHYFLRQHEELQIWIELSQQALEPFFLLLFWIPPSRSKLTVDKPSWVPTHIFQIYHSRQKYSESP